MQAAKMAELYYNQLDDDQRSKIQFVLVNDDSAASDMGRLKSAAMFGGQGPLPAVQDDKPSTFMNELSNNKPSPKDDMALVDKEGHMIKYFPSSQSNMGDSQNNNVRNTVMEVLRADYKNPCVSADDGKKR